MQNIFQLLAGWRRRFRPWMAVVFGPLIGVFFGVALIGARVTQPGPGPTWSVVGALGFGVGLGTFY